MSMISSQIDALRKAAQTERDLGRHELERTLLEAADTICELSGRLTHWELHECPGCKNVVDLQEALDENARLQSQADEWRRVAQSKQDVIDHMRDARAENAKLRELVRDMHKALFSLNLDHCQACPREDACVFVHKSFGCDECAFERDMCELGIEVG